MLKHKTIVIILSGPL